MIVFSDMDGTLLTSDKQMSDATWAMLDELARRGIEFVPCTGRPLSGVFEPILPCTTRSAPMVPASGSSTTVRPPTPHVLRAF